MSVMMLLLALEMSTYIIHFIFPLHFFACHHEIPTIHTSKLLESYIYYFLSSQFLFKRFF